MNCRTMPERNCRLLPEPSCRLMSVRQRRERRKPLMRRNSKRPTVRLSSQRRIRRRCSACRRCCPLQAPARPRSKVYRTADHPSAKAKTLLPRSSPRRAPSARSRRQHRRWPGRSRDPHPGSSPCNCQCHRQRRRNRRYRPPCRRRFRHRSLAVVCWPPRRLQRHWVNWPPPVLQLQLVLQLPPQLRLCRRAHGP